MQLRLIEEEGPPNDARDQQLMPGGQIAIAGRPRVGAWGVAVLLLGFVGGVIGWLDLKHDDPRRADHILKWGIIWSVVWFFLLVVFWLSLQTLGTGSGGSGHGGPLKLHG